ncbi:hypothetical protein F5Y14DRAFT_453542 [Nemania sp. NC0429]|nr:hypothetical protein F5Y14DRAFT_453542 [Nemania sp. NC0429]
MVSRVVFWTGFGMTAQLSRTPGPATGAVVEGVAVRFWQLGLEMRPFFNRGSLWAYPVFAGVGASFGYWIQGVNERQEAVLQERKQLILEKRARRAARDAAAADAA